MIQPGPTRAHSPVPQHLPVVVGHQSPKPPRESPTTRNRGDGFPTKSKANSDFKPSSRKVFVHDPTSRQMLTEIEAMLSSMADRTFVAGDQQQSQLDMELPEVLPPTVAAPGESALNSADTDYLLRLLPPSMSQETSPSPRNVGSSNSSGNKFPEPPTFGSPTASYPPYSPEVPSRRPSSGVSDNAPFSDFDIL